MDIKKKARRRGADASKESKSLKAPPPFRPKAGGSTQDPDPKAKQKERVFNRRVLMTGAQPLFEAPVMLDLPAFDDYALIDSGFERKLERYGPYLIERPEGQALWQPHLSAERWAEADAVFDASGDEDTSGRWKFQNKLAGFEEEDVFALTFGEIAFHARFTAFRHIGFFPEQAAHWVWFQELIEARKVSAPDEPVRVLNLFGYTGIASLIAAKAGAEVTHIDASKKAIGWARQNQELSGLTDRPIRWICEDAMRFVEREQRRGKHYEGIILDPPKYGRGPNGEVWQFFEQAADLLHATRALLSEKPLFVLMSSYAIRASFMATHELARDAFSGLGGHVQSGELLIRENGRARAISTSLFTRWAAE